MSEIVDFCLSLQPIPGLSAVFKIFSYIWTSSQNVQSSKERLKTLAICVAELLVALHRALESGQVKLGNLRERIDSLERWACHPRFDAPS
jgi:hypothetical protein